MSSKQEYWLSGPIPDVPALLQPAAHALLQSVREANQYLTDFPEEKLWEKPFGRASVGFHLRHMTGVLDRMLTYADEKALTAEQFDFLKNEGNGENAPSSEALITDFEKKSTTSLELVPSSAIQSCQFLYDWYLTESIAFFRKSRFELYVGKSTEIFGVHFKALR